MYVLFTSGSTGVPKGVAVSHRAVIDFIDDFIARFGFGPDERIANQAPFDFDVSVKDIYGALATGSTLVVVPRALFSAPAALMEYLQGRDITNMTWAVAALCLITSLHGLEGQQLAGVRRVLFSGEVMPISHLRAWMAHVPQATFVNLYGPTEITCNCLYHVVDPAREYPDGLPLGVPFGSSRNSAGGRRRSRGYPAGRGRGNPRARRFAGAGLRGQSRQDRRGILPEPAA